MKSMYLAYFSVSLMVVEEISYQKWLMSIILLIVLDLDMTGQTKVVDSPKELKKKEYSLDVVSSLTFYLNLVIWSTSKELLSVVNLDLSKKLQ
jgi:hypothetical protein